MYLNLSQLPCSNNYRNFKLYGHHPETLLKKKGLIAQIRYYENFYNNPYWNLFKSFIYVKYNTGY